MGTSVPAVPAASPVGETSELLDAIEQSRAGGYSLPFTAIDRNYLIGMHWVVALGSTLLTHLVLQATPDTGTLTA